MTQGESPHAWLSWEVAELLNLGTVGLYELIWLLNGSDFELSGEEKRSVAVGVARELMSSRKVALYELEWPTDSTVSGPYGIGKLEEDRSFPDQPGKRYLALLLAVAEST